MLTKVEPVINKLGKTYANKRSDKDLKWQAEKQFALTVINRSSQLRQSTPESLQNAILSCATMGLSLNPIKQHVYLIPRKARRRRQGESKEEYAKIPYLAYASPSYRGLSHLAVKSGSVLWIRSDIVFVGDIFEYYGSFQAPKYQMVSHNRTEKNAIGVFAIAKLRSCGDIMCEYIDAQTIQKIRQMSELPNSVMWTSLWTEGWKKSAIRRLYKTLPELPEAFNYAMSQLDENEGYSKEVIEGTVVEETITEKNQEKIKTLLVEYKIKDVDAYLKRLAERYAVESFEEIPDKYAQAAYDMVKLALENR